MRESKFITEVMSSLKAHGCYAYKISDSPTSWTMKQTRFTASKPCDIFANVQGSFVAIECKQMKKWEAFGLKKMRPSQVVALTNVERTGGKAYVFLNVRIKADKKKNIKHENRLIIIDWYSLQLQLKRGSIKAKDLKYYPYIEPIKKVFNLQEWIDFL